MSELENNSETERSKKLEKDAQLFLDNLLTNGLIEQDESTEMHLPPWYDEELFKKGQEYFRTYRIIVTSGMLTGLIAVLAIPSILQVLICTKQSGTDYMAYKRYVRTILHVISWHSHPLKKGSKSWESIAMVRKAHMRSSKSCTRTNSSFVSQKDLALTQFGFCGFSTYGAHRVNIFNEEFLESTCHLWRVIGYMLGIKDEFNICAESWEKTKPRMKVISDQVFCPALENPGPNFAEMTKVLIDGLWPVNTTLTYGSYMFFTKRLAYVPGYEFYDADFPNGVRDKNQKSYYYDLGLWDRFVVCYGLFLVTYLYKFTIVRYYLNFRVWLMDMFMIYFPYVAMYKFGFKWAYVKIFQGDKKNELHID